jgi:dissimilatory sulfite reductase (desulfoviridin) alpha/beta subunit
MVTGNWFHHRHWATETGAWNSIAALFVSAGCVRLNSEAPNPLPVRGSVRAYGRLYSDQMDEMARLAEEYGNGEIRLTTGQNAVTLPNSNPRS